MYLYPDHPTSQGGTSLRHPCDMRSRAAFRFFNVKQTLLSAWTQTHVGVQSERSVAGSQLEQSLICHFLRYLPFISETGIGIVMGLKPWEARRLLFLCFALYCLGNLGFCPDSPCHLRVQEYRSTNGGPLSECLNIEKFKTRQPLSKLCSALLHLYDKLEAQDQIQISQALWSLVQKLTA